MSDPDMCVDFSYRGTPLIGIMAKARLSVRLRGFLFLEHSWLFYKCFQTEATFC